MAVREQEYRMHLIVLNTTGIDERGRLWHRCDGPCVPLDDAMDAIDAVVATLDSDDEFLRGLNMAAVGCDWLRGELRKLAKGREA